MEERHENNFMLFVLYCLVLTALFGLVYAIIQHTLSYSNLQYLAAIGLTFIIIFLLKETLVIFFTSMIQAFKSAKNSIFGKKNKTNDNKKTKELESNLLDATIRLEETEEDNKQLKLSIDEKEAIIEELEKKIENQKEAHHVNEHEIIV